MRVVSEGKGCRRPELPGMRQVWPAMPSDSPAVFVFVLVGPTFRLMRGHIVGPAVRCLYGCWAQPSGLLCLAGGSSIYYMMVILLSLAHWAGSGHLSRLHWNVGPDQDA